MEEIKINMNQELDNDDLGLDMMNADCMQDEELIAFLEKYDNEKPLPANKVMVPEHLSALKGYTGELYGYIREDSGYHVVVGWDGNIPNPVLNADVIGYVGEPVKDLPEAFLCGTWGKHGLEFSLRKKKSDENTVLFVEVYTMKQDVFSRNSGLIETAWMDEKCVVICGCGSVGSCIAVQLARSGVGRFILVDSDCMEIHNVCRHQCNFTDIGRFKVDAVADKISQINPQAQIKKFYQCIQDVRIEDYEEWITPENALFIGACDNRVGNAHACDLAYYFGAPFASNGFMARAWAGEIFTCLPEKQDICYRCAFKTQIENSIAEERRNHFYIGEEELEKAQIEPGLDVDLEFGVSLFDKVVLDILNRNNPRYTPRIYHKMTQFVIFSGTDDRTYADPFWKKAFPTPIALRSLRHDDECRRCENCVKK